MSVELACPGCQKMLRAHDGLLGGDVLCPFCRTVVSVPAPQPAAAVVADPISDIIPVAAEDLVGADRFDDIAPAPVIAPAPTPVQEPAIIEPAAAEPLVEPIVEPVAEEDDDAPLMPPTFDPVPAAKEVAAPVIEPAPVVINPAPTPIKTAPPTIEPTPVVIEPTPPTIEPTPAAIETAPAAIETAPAAIETAPAAIETAPTEPEPQEVACEPVVDIVADAAVEPAVEPAPPQVAVAPTPAAPEMLAQTADGQQYGPVPKSELDGWVADGSINAECQVLRDGDEQWQWASQVYPQLT